MYLPGCPPRPEMLIDSILKLHDKVKTTPLGEDRIEAVEERERESLTASTTSDMKGLLR
jgi:NADH-quinone oxidoreductase subunit B